MLCKADGSGCGNGIEVLCKADGRPSGQARVYLKYDPEQYDPEADAAAVERWAIHCRDLVNEKWIGPRFIEVFIETMHGTIKPG